MRTYRGDEVPEAIERSARNFSVPVLPLSGVLLLLAPLLYLWQGLIRHLSVEWSLNPQYAYGWVVPCLCLYLVWRNLHRNSAEVSRQPGPGGRADTALGLALAIGYAPTRLIQEANPEWRLVSWALAIEVIGLTCVALRLLRSAGFATSRFSLFPILFFLVAVPWPTFVEQPLIRTLTSATTAATAELLGLLGVPTLLHGSIIELGSGAIAVDEACSGIRSFQAALMIALFFGEVYRLSPARGTWCVAAGLTISLLCNFLRITVISFIVAKKAPAALATWHDPAGLSILLACFTGIWLLAFYLRPSDRTILRESKAGNSNQPRCVRFSITSAPVAMAAALLAWILVVELGTEAWYRIHEASLANAVRWHPVVSRDLPGFHELGFGEKSRQFLRFDEGLNVAWTEPDGLRWQAIFLRWNPGKVAVHLARNHTPQDCLLAAGHELVGRSDAHVVSVRGLLGGLWDGLHTEGPLTPALSPSEGERENSRQPTVVAHVADSSLELPFRHYLAGAEGGPVNVFYCLWEDRASGQSSEAEWLSYANRLRPVLAGRRNCGQRSLELAVWGAAGTREAEEAFGQLLPKIIQVEN